MAQHHLLDDETRHLLAQQRLCTACDRRPTHRDRLICPACAAELRGNLAELPATITLLDPTPGSSGTGGGRGAPGFGSRSPARDSVLVLTDDRPAAFDPDRPRNPASVLRTVAWWADHARDAGLLPDPARSLIVDPNGDIKLVGRTIAAECAALTSVLDEAVTRHWAADMCQAIAAAVQHVRYALGDIEPRVPLGECPVVAPSATESAQPCRGRVTARAYGETARCGRCKTTWRGIDELRHLAGQLGDALLDLPGLARYLGTPINTLTTWANRYGWTRHTSPTGRRLYRLTEAQDAWWRAWEYRNPLYGCPTPPGWVRTDTGWTTTTEEPAA